MTGGLIHRIIEAPEPFWAKVLGEVYQSGYAISREMRGPPLSSKDGFPSESMLIDELSEKTGAPPDDVQRTVDTMIGYGLLARDDPKPGGYDTRIGLTQPGFKVAHERELTERREQTNRILAYLTGVLAFSALLGLWAPTFAFPAIIEHVVVIVLVVLILLSLGLVVKELLG